MAIKGLSMSEREEVILPSDPGHPDNPEYKAAVKLGKEPEKPTKFFLKPLSKGCRIELGDMGPSPTMRDGAVTMELRNTRRSYSLVERSLVGWDNFTDDEGKPFVFEAGTIQTAHGLIPGAGSKSMQVLPSFIVSELAQIILRKNGMTKELVGNSDLPSLQPGDQPSATGAATDAPKTSGVSEDAPQPQ